MPNEIDFRRNDPQKVRTWAGEDTFCIFVAPCIVCGARVYEMENGENDPRGPLGLHAPVELVASEYNMAGEDLVMCWGCGDNSRKYTFGVGLAKARWSSAG
jgi:hypothetical protein